MQLNLLIFEEPMPFELTSSQKELLQKKVGRNLLLYQHIELLMKRVLAHSELSVSSQSGHAYRLPAPTSATLSMGMIWRTLRQKVYGRSGIDDLPSPEPSTLRITTRFGIEPADPAEVPKFEAEFAAILEQRNELVHHFIEQSPLGSDELLAAALQQLDARFADAVPIRLRIECWLEGMKAGYQAMAQFIASEDFEKQLELGFLQNSHLVGALVLATQQRARHDGWTDLAAGGQLARREAPEDFDNRKKRFGHESLKRLALAAEIFEVKEEATVGGGTRTLYRLRPEVLAHIEGSDAAVSFPALVGIAQ